MLFLLPTLNVGLNESKISYSATSSGEICLVVVG